MNHDIFLNVNEYLPLRDVVFNNIREAIISGELKPGERLLEKQLSEQIGVSRTPIREALRRLELEGLVEFIPRKGAQVSRMSEKDVKNVLEIRNALESLAAILACENMSDEQLKNLISIKDDFVKSTQSKDVKKMAEYDEAFHDAIFEASNNPKLVQIINNLREQIYRYRLTYLNDKSACNDIIKEHDELTEAIKSRDKTKAFEVASEHIANQEKSIISNFKKHKNDKK